MNILDKIIAHKKLEVAERKQLTSIALLEKSAHFNRSVYSMRENVLSAERSGIIAEFKRQSPSKGIINDFSKPEEVTAGYIRAGASGVSVLTDLEFFGGQTKDLVAARQAHTSPILRKEFIIDEYQLVEAKSMGADAILLIAECLEKDELKQLATTAKGLGLEILMEIHSAKQLEKVNEHIDLLGVNNRNLETFTVDIKTSLDLVNKIPDNVVKISESGISAPETIVQLGNAGFQGFLIGECFMKTKDPVQSCIDFITEVNRLKG